jgi:nucleoside-diphosphate-sugar epimerase
MNTSSKHIILGAGGAISRVLTTELFTRKAPVRLVSRRGFSLGGGEAAKADLTDAGQVDAVIDNGAIVYLLAGLPYRIAIWREQWPRIMKNVVEACSRKKARLVFFDNVYAYGKVDGPMTEETPLNPSSKKGEVRVEIATYLMENVKAGNLNALIARAADFYGPFATKVSVPYLLIFKRLAAGKSAQAMVTLDTKHSYTYTSDCGRALHELATAEDTYNQVWHLPTAAPPPTGREFVAMVAEALGVEPKTSILSKVAMRLAGLFLGDIRELYEMLYQNEFDYIFDSSKFERQFELPPTSYREGIQKTVAFFKQSGALK